MIKVLFKSPSAVAGASGPRGLACFVWGQKMNKIFQLFVVMLFITPGCGPGLVSYWLSLVDWSEAEISNVKFSYNSFGTRMATCRFDTKRDEVNKIVEALGLQEETVLGSFPLSEGCITFPQFGKSELTDGPDRKSYKVLPNVLVFKKDIAQIKNITNRRFRHFFFNINTEEGCVDLISPYG
jgi:hypothetical protein